MKPGQMPAHTPPPPREREPGRLQTALRAIRGVGAVAVEARSGDPRRIVERAILQGVKLAGEGPFYNPLSNPLVLSRALRQLGPGSPTWLPETLMSEIDRRYGGWTAERILQALEGFSRTGVLDPEVPELVRQKLYAVRVAWTSNSAHNEWHTFEKVGAAFNDRLAHFGDIQRMSAGECAVTVALLENLRPDEYANEVGIYIAACCHEDGIYTLEPSKWLKHFEPHLRRLQRQDTGGESTAELRAGIAAKYTELANKRDDLQLVEDAPTAQALRLLAVDSLADAAIATT